MVSPVILVLLDRSLMASPVRRAAFKGLLLYALLALSDGAFAFIPVMVFYWFAYMVFIFGWPNLPRRSSEPSGRPLTAPLATAQPDLVQSGLVQS